MKFPRVLAESEDFFAGLQHPDAPVQIRSAPLKKPVFTGFFLFSEYHFLIFKNCLKNPYEVIRSIR